MWLWKLVFPRWLQPTIVSTIVRVPREEVARDWGESGDEVLVVGWSCDGLESDGSGAVFVRLTD